MRHFIVFAMSLIGFFGSEAVSLEEKIPSSENPIQNIKETEKEFVFSQIPDSENDFSHYLNQTQKSGLEDFAQGAIHILLGEPRKALEGFDLALKKFNLPFVDEFADGTIEMDENNPFSLPEFRERFAEFFSGTARAMIYLGKAVSYDMLDSREEVERSLGLFLLSAASCLDKEIEEELEDDLIDPSAVEFLRSIISMAPSEDVRNLLLAFIEDFSEEEEG